MYTFVLEISLATLYFSKHFTCLSEDYFKKTACPLSQYLFFCVPTLLEWYKSISFIYCTSKKQVKNLWDCMQRTSQLSCVRNPKGSVVCSILRRWQGNNVLLSSNIYKLLHFIPPRLFYAFPLPQIYLSFPFPAWQTSPKSVQASLATESHPPLTPSTLHNTPCQLLLQCCTVSQVLPYSSPTPTRH